MQALDAADERVRTDEEIYQDALAEWQNAIAGMWDAAGKSLAVAGEAARFGQYVRQLSGIPLGLLQLACDRAVRETGKYQVVPSVGAVWDALRKELHNPRDLDQAISLWCEARWARTVYVFGDLTPDPFPAREGEMEPDYVDD